MRNTYKLFDHQINHFDYKEIGPQGVGKNNLPIVNMDKYINSNFNEELHIECLKGLALSEKHFKMGMFIGDLPPEEEKRLGTKSWSRILKDSKDKIHLNAIKDLLEKTNSFRSAYLYSYFGMGATIPWFFGLYLMDNKFTNKTNNGIYNEDVIKNFPLLKEYIKTLPFKIIGRVMFFCTYPGAGVAIHRDWPMEEHSDHNINLFFTTGRPSFIWDEIKKEKIYLEKEATSYFFNNRDYHGVDAENTFRYTLRIDGTFEDEICDELGLIDGKTWCKEYAV